jgi:hypothetical protein
MMTISATAGCIDTIALGLTRLLRDCGQVSAADEGPAGKKDESRDTEIREHVADAALGRGNAAGRNGRQHDAAASGDVVLATEESAPDNRRRSTSRDRRAAAVISKISLSIRRSTTANVERSVCGRQKRMDSRRCR